MSPRSVPLAVRRPWLVVAAAGVLLALAGVFGGSVAELLVSGGFEDPAAESSTAADLVADRFDAGVPNLVAVVDAGDRSVDDPAVADAGLALTSALAAEDGVAEVASYWSLGNAPPLRNDDGTKAMVLVRLGGTENEVLDRAGELLEAYDGPRGDLVVDVGGQAATFAEVNTVIEEDLVTAEMIALPITLVLLVLVFGSVVAGLLPLGIGGFAILGTFGVLRIIASVTDVSIFALNFTTAIGLGLAIDYALLIVSRYREELAAGFDVASAVTRTVRTAGRTVVFSAATVASSLAALLVFRISFLRSFAYAGIAVVALAAVGAVIVLPAVLRLVGHDVDRLRVRKPRTVSETEGMWHRIAVTVMRRPVPVATLAIGFLAVLGLPFLGVELGFPDDRVLPASAETRSVGDTIRAEFSSNEAGALNVVADGVDAGAEAEAVDAYARSLSQLDGVARVDAATGIYVAGAQLVPANPMSARFAAPDATYLSVVPSVEPISPAGEALVEEVRLLPAPFEVVVGGGPAELVDGKAGLLDQLPLALLVIALVTFAVLFLQFGSILVPVKAIVLNLLSLSATFGAMVWIFQDGHLAGVLGFTPTGSLVATMPVLMFCIAFGLSMDYEVFLLSRIKEEYDRTGDNEASVALGLERTGRIVTAAAVLISVVFLAFATSRVSFMQMFGLGMALAVIVDAFLIRAALVPAFMRLAGEANWWAPGPMRRFHDRFGLSEHVDLGDGDDLAVLARDEPVVPTTP
ncbi:MAG: MMPL family transporter [Actinobacteria bacterium]|nr:MMPL family transporter [Actinomycetota bacterium]